MPKVSLNGGLRIEFVGWVSMNGGGLALSMGERQTTLGYTIKP